MKIYNTLERAEPSAINYYFLAGVVGIVLAILGWVIVKGLAWTFRIIIGNWLIIIGGIAALLVVRKILFRKKTKLVIEGGKNESPNR